MRSPFARGLAAAVLVLALSGVATAETWIRNATAAGRDGWVSGVAFTESVRAGAAAVGAGAVGAGAGLGGAAAVAAESGL